MVIKGNKMDTERSSGGKPQAGEDPEEVKYMQEEEQMVISIDVGNSFSSVTMAHLSWNVAPLSRSPSASPSIRTVLKYPGSTPSLTSVSSRTPSFIYYDSEDAPRAHGADCLMKETKEMAEAEGWAPIKGFKEQMRPSEATQLAGSSSKEPKKLTKRLRVTSYLEGAGKVKSTEGELSSKASSQSLPPLGSQSSFNSKLSEVALEDKMQVDKDDGSSSRSSTSSKESHGKTKEKKEKSSTDYPGPKLRDIWGDHLKHLVACARAYYIENVPNGEKTFDRLWPNCIFVIPHPADWITSGTDLIRVAMVKANLLHRDAERERVVFVRDSEAIASFVQRHASSNWLQAGDSFVVCDAAELGVSIIGYRACKVKPCLELKPIEPVTRLDAGVRAIMASFEEFVKHRLAKTKFKSLPIFTSTLLGEFESKVLPHFTGPSKASAEDDEIKLRVVPEGMENEIKGAMNVDTGAKIRAGWMTLTAEEVENVFKPSLDAIIVRLSSIVSRADARHIVLAGGFGESPYLLRRLQDAFQSRGVRIVVPEIPVHTAVSEGALRLYLSQSLIPRQARYNLGFSVAVDSRSHFAEIPHMHKREVFHGSGGSKLITGKFSPLIKAGDIPSQEPSFSRPYHMRYRLGSGEPPLLSTVLWAQDPNSKEAQDGWIYTPQGDMQKGFRPVCQITANLESLVAASEVHGQGEKAFVSLDVKLIVIVGEFSLEAMAIWRVDGKLEAGPASIIADEFF